MDRRTVGCTSNDAQTSTISEDGWPNYVSHHVARADVSGAHFDFPGIGQERDPGIRPADATMENSERNLHVRLHPASGINSANTELAQLPPHFSMSSEFAGTLLTLKRIP
jgi:hypothetical protein